MKKHTIFLAAFAAVALAGCSVEAPAPEENFSEEYISIEAVFADAVPTRTERQADGSVLWLPGDEISLFYSSGTNGGARFTAQNTEPSASTVFTGKITSSFGQYFYGIYPYKETNACVDKQLLTSLPSEQEAVAGTFADDLFISVGKNVFESMTFYHVCGGVKFTVDTPGVRTVTFSALGGEALAGDVTLSLNGQGVPSIVSVTNSSSQIVLNAPDGGTFVPGVAYHIVTLPAVLSKGAMMTFDTGSQRAFRIMGKATEIHRCGFRTLEHADKDLEWTSTAGEVFQISPLNLSIGAKEQEFIVTVFSSIGYHADIFCDWITPVSTSGSTTGGFIHIFKAAKNDTESQRMGVISFCNDNMTCNPVIVTQDGFSWKNADFVHHSLGMRFTATWCGYCPNMSDMFHAAKERLGDRWEYVNLHPTSSSIGFTGTDALFNQFRLNGYPTAVIDGRRIVNNQDISTGVNAIANYVTETEENYPVTTSMGISSAISGSSLNVDVDVYCKNSEDYLLTVLVLESGIVATQANNYTGVQDPNYVHDNVARIALTSSTGVAFTATKDDVSSFHYTATIPSSYNKDKLSILAWTQRKYGSQTVLRSGNYGDYYIDNCRLVPVGTTADVETK